MEEIRDQQTQVCHDKDFNIATNSSTNDHDQRRLCHDKEKVVETTDPGNCEKLYRDNVLLSRDKG